MSRPLSALSLGGLFVTTDLQLTRLPSVFESCLFSMACCSTFDFGRVAFPFLNNCFQVEVDWVDESPYFASSFSIVEVRVTGLLEYTMYDSGGDTEAIERDISLRLLP